MRIRAAAAASLRGTGRRDSVLRARVLAIGRIKERAKKQVRSWTETWQLPGMETQTRKQGEKGESKGGGDKRRGRRRRKK